MNATLEIQEHTATVVAPAFTIADETLEYVLAREALLDRAMGECRRRKSSEKLRRGRLPAEGLAFAALGEDGSLAGSVRLWDIHAGLDAFGFPVSALLLGPLAVDPSAAGCGIGSALMRHAIDEAKDRGHGAILLVGDPEYYERFSFTAEKTGELAMPGPYEKRRFLALELKPGHLDGAHGILRASGRKVARVEASLRQSA
ncbi:N-acetyltransferase [Ochrobactrum oryzae]|uniref:GNAT family N-acetyltransferase n=1 Tax=Brucella oryzae TaxID=335286 RepID=A0A2S7IWX3_9HYPH|nr:N-acetyltransferase [Brucella oryzae]NKC23134.1 N-acetyltransferase [Brucella oryzae]PQA72501.1 GNAT family N-acetyltransferase [Brucella oryzae]